MIAHITGKIRKKKQLSIIVDVSGISYEVMVPPAVMKGIDKALTGYGIITLITYHYYQMDQSKAIPVLIGFLNEIEKEFFEYFITVSGVGPKAACRARRSSLPGPRICSWPEKSARSLGASRAASGA
jgi:Holliday junction DNA helicase RuvA